MIAISRRLRTGCAAGLAALVVAAAACAAPDGRAGGSADTPVSAAAGDTRASAAAGGERKPTAPISIGHEWLEPPAVGRSLRLRISVAGSRELDDVRIALVGREGLVVDTASATTRVPGIEAGTAYTFEPLVLAAVPGTHYLGVSVTAEVDAREQTRSVTIPVRLGEPASSREAGAATNGADASERVRSLPAEERVDRR